MLDCAPGTKSVLSLLKLLLVSAILIFEEELWSWLPHKCRAQNIFLRIVSSLYQVLPGGASLYYLLMRLEANKMGSEMHCSRGNRL